jgi:hypothetical protein
MQLCARSLDEFRYPQRESRTLTAIRKFNGGIGKKYWTGPLNQNKEVVVFTQRYKEGQYMEAPTQCEQALGLPVGTFGDTLNRTYDFMAAWLSAHC